MSKSKKVRPYVVVYLDFPRRMDSIDMEYLANKVEDLLKANGYKPKVEVHF